MGHIPNPTETNQALWIAAEPYIKDGSFGNPLQVWAQEFRIWFANRLTSEFQRTKSLIIEPKEVRRAIRPGPHTIESRPDEFWMNEVRTKIVRVSDTRDIQFQTGINYHWPSVQWGEARFDVTPFESFDPMI